MLIDGLLPGVGAAVAGFAAVMLASAGLEKLRAPADFAGIVAQYRLLPDRLVPVVARLIPPVEVLLGTGLILMPASAAVRVAAAALMFVFASAIAINLRRGRTAIDCGCFGDRLRQGLRRGLVIRNLLLASILLAPWPFAPIFSLLHLQGLLAGGLIFLLHIAAASLRPDISYGVTA